VAPFGHGAIDNNCYLKGFVVVCRSHCRFSTGLNQRDSEQRVHWCAVGAAARLHQGSPRIPRWCKLSDQLSVWTQGWSQCVTLRRRQRMASYYWRQRRGRQRQSPRRLRVSVNLIDGSNFSCRCDEHQLLDVNKSQRSRFQTMHCGSSGRYRK